MRKILLLLLGGALCMDAMAQSTRIIVRFKDKNGTPFSLSTPSSYLSPRSIQRRVTYNLSTDSTDLPCNPAYINLVMAQGAVTVLSQSKWLNQILIKTSDAAALTKIMALPFVKATMSIAPRLAAPQSKFDLESIEGIPAPAAARVAADYYSYGNSYNQVHMHEGEFLHNKGFRGQNMIVTVLDAGFQNYLTNTAFDSVRLGGQILGVEDFVAFDSSVNEDNNHGRSCLSTMAANWPGRFVGTAPKANFFLVRTEDAATEYPVEEHNWVVGAEFADSCGTDMITSSLGYTTFDDAAYNHTYGEFYKNAAMITQGATLAARKGIIVTNSAGNSGTDSWKYLGFPADADSVCAVGAVTSTGAISTFSSYGYPGKIKPNVVSKGTSTTIAGTTGPSTGNGTSFSNPNLCGLITCLWQAFPRFNNMKVLDAVYKSADRYNNPTDRFGFGIPNMKTAYRLLKKDENVILYGNDWYWASPDYFTDTVAVRFIGQIDGNAKVEMINPSGSVVATQSFVTEKEEVYNYVFRNLIEFPAGPYTVRYSDDSLRTRDTILNRAAILPVTDLTLKASWIGDLAVVNWSTSSEIKTGHYAVQRSFNSSDFTEVGVVKATNSSSTTNYSFEDKGLSNLAATAVYYRLKINDLDGRQKLSNIVTLQKKVTGLSMVINPNPAREVATLTVTSKTAIPATIEIRNANGQLVKRQASSLMKGINTLRINLNGLSKGEYFIRMNTGTSSLQDKLIVL